MIRSNPEQDSPFLSSSSSNSSDSEVNEEQRSKCNHAHQLGRGKGKRRRSSDVQSQSSRSAEREEWVQKSAADEEVRHRGRSNDSRRSRSRERDAHDSYHKARPDYNGHHRSSRGNDRGTTDRTFRSARDGRYQDGNLFIPSLSRPLVPYQQFASMQNRHIPNLYQQYEKYKEDHSQNHAKAFLREHEYEQWFLEKYDPFTKYDLARENKQRAQAVDPFSDWIDPNYLTVCLRSIPVWVSRQMLQNQTQCDAVYFSEPLRMYNFERIAWIKFTNEDNYQRCLSDPVVMKNQNEGDFRQLAKKSTLQNKEIQTTPKLPADAEPRDLKLAQALIEIFDKEMETKYPTQFPIKPSEQLQFRVRYLRKVHGYCFYTGIRCADERCLAIKTGPMIRSQALNIERASFTQDPQYSQAVEFEKVYVAAANEIIKAGAQLLVNPYEDEILNEMKNQFCADKCQVVKEGEKYKCDICGKGFRGAEFVHKHIRNKHEDVLEDKFNKSFFKGQARDAYFKDATKLENPPIGHSFGQQGYHAQPRVSGDRAGIRGGRVTYRGRDEPEVVDGGHDEPQKREYIDYDDPTIGNSTVVQINAVKVFGKVDRALVSYDDLF